MENLELKKELEAYNEYTLKLIERLEEEDYDSLDGLLNKRQQALDNINKLDYEKEEFAKIVEELQILVYQKKVSELMLRKREETKIELNKISNSKNASNMYNRRNVGSSMFNKRI